MDVLRLSGEGVERRGPDDLDGLLDNQGIVWVDVPEWDDDAAAVLTERFGIHQRAVADCARRNPVPKLTSTPATSSSSCTHPNAVREATCTTSSSTSSSGRTG